MSTVRAPSVVSLLYCFSLNGSGLFCYGAAVQLARRPIPLRRLLSRMTGSPAACGEVCHAAIFVLSLELQDHDTPEKGGDRPEVYN